MAGARKKKRGGAEAKGSDPFVVLFTALMLILLAFFILLSTIAQVDERRKRLALGSLMGSFGILPSGMGTDTKGEYAPDSNPIMAGVRKEAFLRVLGTLFKGVSSQGKVRVFLRKGKVVISFRDDVLFPPGVTEVSPRAFRILDEVANAIRTVGQPIRIEGHTDTVPGRHPLDNWRFSARRAIAVLRYLRDGCQVPAHLLSATGYSDTRPADGDADPGSPAHRRVEIVFDQPMGVSSG